MRRPEDMFPDDDEALRQYLIDELGMTPFMAGQYVEIVRGRGEGDVVIEDEDDAGAQDEEGQEDESN